jgi:predicted transcriptional regulator
MPITLKLPYQQRFVGAAALQKCGQTLRLRLLETQRSERLLKRHLHADVTLAQLRLNWRQPHDWQLISLSQFEHAARLMDEVGRLLGAWLKAAKANAQRANLP